MKRFATILLILSPVFMTACSSIQVETDYDRQADFSSYHTYRWIPHMRKPDDNPLMKDPLIESHVQSAVDAALAAKGFTRIMEGDPDFLVAYYFTSRKRVDINHYYGYWYPHTSVYTYKEGTLIVDMVDREEKQLIWRGWATGVLEDRTHLKDQIDLSVEKLMKRFPPDEKREKASW
jgi:hypothetical protein